jgi:uracil-DNA glycosylase family 4
MLCYGFGDVSHKKVLIMTSSLHPPLNCSLCDRLKEHRDLNRDKFPGFHNAPVMPFGDDNPQLLIVGLAPGLMGANQTGRPFTGDYAGDLLYGTLLKFGLAEGTYQADPKDGLRLLKCRITNAVKCWPPENKPTGEEIRICNSFLAHEITDLKQKGLLAILCLGRIAHDSVLKALALKQKDYPFGHANAHVLENGLRLYDSYHCSRYNTNTGKLTTEMFEAVFEKMRAQSI